MNKRGTTFQNIFGLHKFFTILAKSCFECVCVCVPYFFIWFYSSMHYIFSPSLQVSFLYLQLFLSTSHIVLTFTWFPKCLHFVSPPNSNVPYVRQNRVGAKTIFLCRYGYFFPYRLVSFVCVCVRMDFLGVVQQLLFFSHERWDIFNSNRERVFFEWFFVI